MKGGEKGKIKIMKKDKFCVSRILVYLVLLLVLGGGILWGVNYMNSQKMGSKPKAAGQSNTGKGIIKKPKCIYDSNCDSLAYRMNVPMWYDKLEPTRYPGLLCCRPIKSKYANSNFQITPVPTITVAIGECIQKKFMIAEAKTKDMGGGYNKVIGCTYYDGGYIIDWPYVHCTTKYTTDLGKCGGDITVVPSATIMPPMKDQVIEKCRSIKGLIVKGNGFINQKDDIRFSD